jgi:hypothetical protein
MIYLEEKPGPSYEPYIVRTKDFLKWEMSPYNPILKPSDDDKKIANPKLTSEQVARIKNAVNVNNSDIDLCEFKGKTIINYSWGNQTGIEFLAAAEYDGSMGEFFEAFFPG